MTKYKFANIHKYLFIRCSNNDNKRLTRIASGEPIWGSRSKKGRLLKNQLS